MQRIKLHIQSYWEYFRFKPQLAFYFLFVIFVAANGVIIPVGRDWTLPQIMSMGIIFFGTLRFIVGHENRQIKILFVPFLITSAWLVLIAISIIFSPPEPYSPFSTGLLQSYNIIGVMYYFWIVLDLLLMWAVYSVVKKGDLLLKTFRILIYSSVIYSIYGIYQYLMASFLGLKSNPVVYALNYHYLYYDYIVRLLSLSREPLYFANYICPVIIISVSLFITKTYKVLSISKRTLLIITGINLIAFFLAKSTGGFIAMLGSFSLIVFVYFRSHLRLLSFKRAAYGVVVLLIFALSFYQLFGREVQRRIVRLFDPSSGYGRIVSLIQGVESVWENPLLGFGLGHSIFFLIGQIHNAYLNIAAETGLLSLICFVAFLLYLTHRLFKSYRMGGMYRGLILGIAGAFVYILIQWLSFFAYIVLFAWFLFGIILALPHALKNLHQYKGVLKFRKTEWD